MKFFKVPIIAITLGILFFAFPTQVAAEDACICTIQTRMEHKEQDATSVTNPFVPTQPVCEFTYTLPLETDGNSTVLTIFSKYLLEISGQCPRLYREVITGPSYGIIPFYQTYDVMDKKGPTTFGETVITETSCPEIKKERISAVMFTKTHFPTTGKVATTEVLGDTFTLGCWFGEVPVDDKPEDTSIPREVVARRLNNLNQFKGVGRGQYAITQIIGRLIFWFLGIIGTIAIAMFVYAGMLWMIRGGNAESRKKAMTIMLWTTLGIAVLLGSAGIVEFIFDAFPDPLP